MTAQSSDEVMTALRAVVVEAEYPALQYAVSVYNHEAFIDGSFDVVRPAHAENAARLPDGVVVFPHDEITICMTSTLVEPPAPKAPFALLTLGFDEEMSRRIRFAYRIYATAGEDLPAIAADPVAAFHAFLMRYGMTFRSPEDLNRALRFVPALVLERPSPQSHFKVDGGEDVDRLVVAGARRERDGRGIVVWQYVVNGDAYLADVAELR